MLPTWLSSEISTNALINATSSAGVHGCAFFLLGCLVFTAFDGLVWVPGWVSGTMSSSSSTSSCWGCVLGWPRCESGMDGWLSIAVYDICDKCGGAKKDEGW